MSNDNDTGARNWAVVTGTLNNGLYIYGPSTAAQAEAFATRAKRAVQADYQSLYEAMHIFKPLDPDDVGYDLDGKFIVVSGNPVEGLQLHGPYATQEQAQMNADADAHYGGDSWVMDMVPEPALLGLESHTAVETEDEEDDEPVSVPPAE